MADPVPSGSDVYPGTYKCTSHHETRTGGDFEGRSVPRPLSRPMAKQPAGSDAALTKVLAG